MKNWKFKSGDIIHRKRFMLLILSNIVINIGKTNVVCYRCLILTDEAQKYYCRETKILEINKNYIEESYIKYKTN